MVAKRIIPCLDVDKGRVVKGINFIRLKDAGDPVAQARFYDQEAADELVFLDITASSDRRNIMVDIVKKTAEQVFIPFTVGGGLRSLQNIRDILKAGADKISLNTAAVQNKNLINQGSATFGSQCIVLAVDAKRTAQCDSGFEVYIHGGRTPTGIDAVAWAQEAVYRGAGEILLTSMDRDGTKDGYDLELTRSISTAVNVPVIASGGCGSKEHFYEVFTQGCADAALAASIFHFNEYSIQEVKQYLADQGVRVRQ
jgi:cyclase